jgi:hypothetical protein
MLAYPRTPRQWHIVSHYLTIRYGVAHPRHVQGMEAVTQTTPYSCGGPPLLPACLTIPANGRYWSD